MFDVKDVYSIIDFNRNTKGLERISGCLTLKPSIINI